MLKSIGAQPQSCREYVETEKTVVSRQKGKAMEEEQVKSIYAGLPSGWIEEPPKEEPPSDSAQSRTIVSSEKDQPAGGNGTTADGTDSGGVKTDQPVELRPVNT